MARYFVIAPTLINNPTTRVAMPGETIDHSGPAGSSLVAIDSEALAMKRGASRFNVRQEKRYRAGLSKSVAAQLAKLESERAI